MMVLTQEVIRQLLAQTFILLVIPNLAFGSRILAYVVTPSYSHQVVFRPLWRELSLRGHNVTLLTTHPMNDPALTNLTEIDLSSSYEVMSRGLSKVLTSEVNPFTSMRIYIDTFNDVMDHQMRHPFVQDLLNNPSMEFDVFLLESMMAPAVAFAKRFECPLVGFTSLPAIETLNNYMGVPTHPVLYPDVLLPFDKAETLPERVISLVYQLFMQLVTDFYVHPIQNVAIERYFGKGYGTVHEHVANTSLMIVNTNSVLGRSRPMVPTVVQVGGINRAPPKPLAEVPESHVCSLIIPHLQPLKTILDTSTDGFIYFSLGSNVKSKDLPPQTREVLLEAFAELPYRILWKFELDDLPKKPENVIISRWFPQTDVLKHPNIKLFITQGGLQSMEEAIFEGVPMVGMPVFADQPGNVQKMVRKGFGLYVNIWGLEKGALKQAVVEVIENPTYRSKVREASRLALDQPIGALELAVWWVEYVIRHKGATHFQSPLRHISWCQYLLLDVIAVLLLVIVLFLTVTYISIRIITKYIRKVLFQPKFKSE
uniref:Uncharacterized protein n=1 Tax=Photinus pyralis TaxID=7054 RepID=A0A1Y1KFZ1_PHOPY